MKPVVAILGRPNVGKSTLFNRITRSRDALVDDMPGVTRDRHYGNASWDDVEFTLIDTGGFLESDEDRFANEIRFQVKEAIDDADVVVLVLDGKNGASPFDSDLIEILRSVDMPVFYIVNKIDGETQEENLYDFYTLGIDPLYPVSGEHGYGVPDFLDELVASFPDEEDGDGEDDDIINVAVVGRPNVGKSSLINKILGKKRHVVSDLAGTTRDAVDSIHQVGDKTYRFIDTAGIRRKGKVSIKLEKYSILKSLKSLDRCDVALVLVDASEGITDQDITIAGYAHERGCGCIFLLNKWDAVDSDMRNPKHFYDELERQAKYLSFVPAITISALTGQRVHKIFGMIEEVYSQHMTRIPTSEVNRIVEWATERTPPPMHKGKRLKFYYATQVGVQPPTFVCFVNYPEAVHFSYHRYLVNQIREYTRLDITPVKLLFRQRSGKIEFEAPKTENTNRRNMGDIDKVSRNKMKKRKERKENSKRKMKRDGVLDV